jgi:hypothetical protein
MKSWIENLFYKEQAEKRKVAKKLKSIENLKKERERLTNDGKKISPYS